MLHKGFGGVAGLGASCCGAALVAVLQAQATKAPADTRWLWITTLGFLVLAIVGVAGWLLTREKMLEESLVHQSARVDHGGVVVQSVVGDARAAGHDIVEHHHHYPPGAAAPPKSEPGSLTVTSIVDEQRQYGGKILKSAILRVQDPSDEWVEDCYAKVTQLLWESGGVINDERRMWWSRWPALKNPDTYLHWRGFGKDEKTVRFQGSAIVEVALPSDDAYYLAAVPEQAAVRLSGTFDFALAVQIGAKDRKSIAKFYQLSIHPPTFSDVYIPGMPDRMEFFARSSMPSVDTLGA